MELSALSNSLPAAVVDKRELRRQYKESPPPMGVYVVRNLANQRVLVGASTKPEAAMNRLRFELAMKSHRRRRARARGPELKPRAWLRLNAARRDAGETAHADLKLRDCLNGLKAPCSSFASR